MGLLPEQQVTHSLATGALRRLEMRQPTYAIEFLAARRHDETDPIILNLFEQVLKMTI